MIVDAEGKHFVNIIPLTYTTSLPSFQEQSISDVFENERRKKNELKQERKGRKKEPEKKERKKQD